MSEPVNGTAVQQPAVAGGFFDANPTPEAPAPQAAAPAIPPTPAASPVQPSVAPPQRQEVPPHLLAIADSLGVGAQARNFQGSPEDLGVALADFVQKGRAAPPQTTPAPQAQAPPAVKEPVLPDPDALARAGYGDEVVELARWAKQQEAGLKKLGQIDKLTNALQQLPAVLNQAVSRQLQQERQLAQEQQTIGKVLGELGHDSNLVGTEQFDRNFWTMAKHHVDGLNATGRPLPTIDVLARQIIPLIIEAKAQPSAQPARPQQALPQELPPHLRGAYTAPAAPAPAPVSSNTGDRQRRPDGTFLPQNRLTPVGAPTHHGGTQSPNGNPLRDLLLDMGKDPGPPAKASLDLGDFLR